MLATGLSRYRMRMKPPEDTALNPLEMLLGLESVFSNVL